MFCLPVAWRASLTDASTASAPEFQKNCEDHDKVSKVPKGEGEAGK